jgi:hypothetical protein
VSQYKIQDYLSEVPHLQETNKKIQINKKAVNSTVLHQKQKSVMPADITKFKSPTIDNFLFQSDDHKVANNIGSLHQSSQIKTEIKPNNSKYRHERTKSDCPSSIKKPENPPQTSGKLNPSHISTKEAYKGINNIKKVSITKETTQTSHYGLMTTPASPTKNTQEHIVSKVEKQGAYLAVSKISQEKKVSAIHDVIDEEPKASHPHEGGQKLAGWHKRSASDGNTIMAKIERMKEAHNTKYDNPIKQSIAASKKANDNSYLKKSTNAFIIHPETNLFAAPRCISNAENYYPIKNTNDSKYKVNKLQCPKLTFDASISDSKPYEIKENKENSESESKLSKFHNYEMLSKQNVKTKSDYEHEHGHDQPKVNNFFSNPKVAISACNEQEHRAIIKKVQDNTMISPVTQYSSNKKIPASAIPAKGLSVANSPERKQGKMDQSEGKHKKNITTYISSASKPIVVQKNLGSAKKDDKKPVASIKQEIKEISPLSIANVERLQNQSSTAALIQKIATRMLCIHI